MKTKYPDLVPVFPIPGHIMAEMAPKLDISASLLYLLTKKGHSPSDITRRRIHKATGLPQTIWTLPRHETIEKLYDWFTAKQAAAAAAQAPQTAAEPSAVEAIL